MAEKGLAVVPIVPFVVTMMGLEVVVLDNMAFDFLLGAVNLSKLDFTRGLEPGARVVSLIGLETSLTESDTVKDYYKCLQCCVKPINLRC